MKSRKAKTDWVQIAIVYITNGNRVLVYCGVDFPDETPQVPTGTILPGESPESEAMRLAYEITGLEGIKMVRGLATVDFDARELGKDQVHERWFYHLIVSEQVPTSWIRQELHGGPDPNMLAFTWEPIAGLAERLEADQGALLQVLDL